MRLLLLKSRLFFLALVLLFCGSSAPILAIQNSGMMRVSPLKAGHSKWVLANNNPVMFVDPTGLSPNLGSVRDDFEGRRPPEMSPEQNALLMELIKLYPPIGTADAVIGACNKAMSEDGLTLDDLATFAAEKLRDRLGGKAIKGVGKGLKGLRGGRGRFKAGQDAQNQFNEIQDAQSKLRRGQRDGIVIDSVEKSRQRDRNSLNRIQNLQDAIDEYD